MNSEFSPAPGLAVRGLRKFGPRRKANGRREITVGHLAGVKSLHSANAAPDRTPEIGGSRDSRRDGTTRKFVRIEMSKKPIYLDDRERDLARRVFGYISKGLRTTPSNAGDLSMVARNWMADEIDALSAKFTLDD
jgi:hypothetical protein